MSHIPGHWEDNDQTLSTVGADRALRKFGTLKLCKDDQKPSYDSDQLIDFPFLFFNNRRFKGDAGPINKLIGCHIILTEFETGNETIYLPMAQDIVDYSVHKNAEDSFINFLNEDSNFISKHGLKTADIGAIRTKHRIDTPNNSGHHAVEQYSPVVIDDAIQILEKSKEKDDHHLHILRQTSSYLRTPSFKILYGKTKPLEWIVNAIKKENQFLMELSDFYRKCPQKLV